MKHIQETSRAQTLLLPACVDDYVVPDNVVRFIEAFVESLNLGTAGFGRTLAKPRLLSDNGSCYISDDLAE